MAMESLVSIWAPTSSSPAVGEFATNADPNRRDALRRAGAVPGVLVGAPPPLGVEDESKDATG